jgi:hypothetical protein
MCTTDGQPKDSYRYSLSSCCPVFARALWRGNLSLSKNLTKCLKIQNPETGGKKRRGQWMTVLNPLYSMKHTSKHSTLNVYRTALARFPSNSVSPLNRKALSGNRTWTSKAIKRRRKIISIWIVSRCLVISGEWHLKSVTDAVTVNIITQRD